MARDLKLYAFGHHPDLSLDFCIEVDDLVGYAYDVRLGLNVMPGRIKERSQWPFWGRLSHALRFAREQGDRLDDMARAAIPTLRRLEAYALRRDDAPRTALPHEIGA